MSARVLTQSKRMTDTRTLILGVAASDSHAVANQLIAHMLKAHGFTVVNLGTCTTIDEFAAAHRDHPEAEAIVIGSLNGHVYEDLLDLRKARAAGLLDCPVILGGNLSVGADKSGNFHDRLYELGVDHILDDPSELIEVLDRVRANGRYRESGLRTAR